MRPSEIRPGIRRLCRLALGRSAPAEADDELLLHLQLRTDQLIREGLSPDEARAEAERRFGSIDEERARFQSAARRREGRRRFREWIEIVGQDMRYAFRTLNRDAAFATFAVLIVGLGIGASVTVFSLVNGVLLRPLPFRDPQNLIWISNISDDGRSEWRLQVSHFVDLGRRSKSLDEIAGYYGYYKTGNSALLDRGEIQRLTRVPVTCNFFPFLGIKPILGRSFSPDECLQNAAPTLLLTEATWRQRFASDPTIVGRTLTINDQPMMVIGVVPSSFDFPSIFAPGTAIEFFSPFPLSEQTDRQGNTLVTLGRLKPNVSVDRARPELVQLGKDLTAEFPRRNTIRPKVLRLDERINGQVRPALFVLACAVGVLMLIVCANLSSLQFARMTSRQRELAVRLALGAGRRRLIRQTLTESLMLAGAGAALGIVLSVAGTKIVSQLRAFDIPMLSRVNIDVTALGVATLVAIATGLFIGLLPALHTPSDVHDALKDGLRGSTRGGRHAQVRSALVVAEIAMACVLLVSSGLLVRSFLRVLDVQLGFRPEATTTLRVDPTKRIVDQTTANAYYADIIRRARAIPGVKDAALADLLPFAGNRSWAFAGAGQVYPRGQMPEGFVRVVSDGYFKTMGIRFSAGRDFTQGDTPEAEPVVIINESLAQTLWPGTDPIGQVMGQGCWPKGCRVVGVVANVRHNALEGEFTGEVYFPIRQFGDYSIVNLVVRTDLAPAQLAASVRSALGPIAPDAVKNQWRPLQQLIDKVASPRRFIVVLLGAFAGFALILAALGIYALISYGVTQRTAEIGIRLALGASASQVHASILRGTLALTGVGVTLGVLATLVLVPSLSGMLFGVQWTDPASFGFALVLLVAVGAAAGHFPARRASRVDPGAALRES
jgi:predicted permease